MHYLLLTLIFLTSLIFFACQSEPDPQAIVAQAIEAHGGQRYDESHISFRFRDRHYDIYLDQGQFTYERSWQDSLGKVHDVLNNQGFVRTVGGKKMNLSEEDQSRYANGLNAVVYFALLPYGLDDQAVNTEYLGLDSIRDEPYHQIRVTFDQQGGGRDFEDVYVYWFHRDRHTMDYLAYEFHVDGGGTRFREAYNVREVNGIRFADYVNYTDTVHTFSLEEYNEQFEAGRLQEVSRVALENVEVETIKRPAVAARKP